MTDAQRELAIEHARQRMTASSLREAQQDYWQLMRGLIAERSPDQIRRMERERGLRAS